EDFMYQADNKEISSARKERMPYPRFTKVIINHFISKDNTIFMRNRINFPTVHDDTLLAYKTCIDYDTWKVPPKKARKFKKPASPKFKIVPVSPNEPTQKGKHVKRPAKKATTTLRTGVVIRDTPDKSVSKKKASGSSEGCDFELEVPDVPTGKTKDIPKGTGVKPGVPDVSKEDSSDSDDDSWGDSEDESDVHDKDDNDDDDGNDDDSGNDDGGNDAQDSERTDSDDDKNPSFTLKDYKEEEQDEEYVHTPEKDKYDDEEKMYEEDDNDLAKELYGDLNITQGLKDTDMTNVEQGGAYQKNDSHESGFVHKEEDAHVTLTTAQTNKSPNRSDIQKNLYNELVEAYNSKKDIITSYGDVVTLKRGRDNKDKDEDPSTGSDQGMKRRKSSKDAKPSKGLKVKGIKFI
nr:hypothetical protein [Tanacetum cinerariifolium]